MPCAVQAAADAAQAAEQAHADASRRLLTVRTSLPQPHASASITTAASEAGSLKLLNSSSQQERYEEAELSPAQRRMLAEAEAELAAARGRAEAALEASTAAGVLLGVLVVSGRVMQIPAARCCSRSYHLPAC